MGLFVPLGLIDYFLFHVGEILTARRKELRIVSETSGTISNAPIFELQGSQNKKRKRKVMRKFLKRL